MLLILIRSFNHYNVFDTRHFFCWIRGLEGAIVINMFVTGKSDIFDFNCYMALNMLLNDKYIFFLFLGQSLKIRVEEFPGCFSLTKWNILTITSFNRPHQLPGRCLVKTNVGLHHPMLLRVHKNFPRFVYWKFDSSKQKTKFSGYCLMIRNFLQFEEQSWLRWLHNYPQVMYTFFFFFYLESIGVVTQYTLIDPSRCSRALFFFFYNLRQRNDSVE